MSKMMEIKRKRFKTLYLSGNYRLTKIANELGVCRTTMYNWKQRYFPGDRWNKRNEKQFLMYFKSGIIDTNELALLTKMHPVSVNRFKRKFKEFNDMKNQSNVFNHNNLKDELLNNDSFSIN